MNGKAALVGKNPFQKPSQVLPAVIGRSFPDLKAVLTDSGLRTTQEVEQDLLSKSPDFQRVADEVRCIFVSSMVASQCHAHICFFALNFIRVACKQTQASKEAAAATDTARLDAVRLSAVSQVESAKEFTTLDPDEQVVSVQCGNAVMFLSWRSVSERHCSNRCNVFNCTSCSWRLKN